MGITAILSRLARSRHLHAISAVTMLFAALSFSYARAKDAGAEELAPYFQMLSWRNVGPDRGGRSIAVAGSATRPTEYYFGATGGGLWKTIDSGTSWRPVTDGQIGSSSVGAVAVAPSNPNVVYLGMGEGQLRSNVMQGDGVYKSVDGGDTWRHVGLAKTKTVTTIRVHPKNPDIVYVAALGDPFAPTEDRGVFRSRDGGESWEKVLFRSPDAGAIDLAMDAKNPEILFATIWQVYRKPWKLWSGGPQSGLFKSMDGGESWVEITRNKGLPQTVLGKMTVAISGADSSRIYANIEAAEGGLYRSDDGGESWFHVNGDRKLWQRSFYFLQVRTDPKDRDTVYVLSFRLEKSTDGGRTFSEIPTQHVDIHDLWIDPADPKRMIVGDDGGGSVTVNGGATWTEQDYPTAQIYRLSTTNDFPYHICGAQQDNTSICVVSRSQSYGAYPDYYTVSSSESGYVTPHPRKPGVFFTGLTNGLQRYDRETGQLRDVQPFPYLVMGEPAKSMQERWNWTYPIVFSPKSPHALYVGSQRLWRSVDEGGSWKTISPDLTRADPETLGETGGPIILDQDGPEVYGTLYTISASPLDKNLIWTGSDDGLIHITRNGGQSWVNVTPSDLPVNTRVSFIEASSHESGAAYIAAKRYEMGDRRPYLWKTKDFGASWSRIDSAFSAEEFTHAIRSDPVREGLLFVATENGVHISFDDGARWASLSLNLPTTPVSGLEIKDNDLVISTHGRSFYVLEGVSTLRQLPNSGGDGNAILFKPADAYRSIIPAQIDFYLKEASDDLSIDIVGADGGVIRRLITAGRFEAGAHRMNWDLRHDGAVVFEGMILESTNPKAGPFAVPGEYTVRLFTNGKMYKTFFAVKTDPRNATPPKDLHAQLSLALEARNATSRANETVIEIRALRSEIERQVSEKSADPGVQAQAVLSEIADIESALYQVKNRSPKDKIAFPVQLNDRLAGLLALLCRGDGKPTRAQYEVFDLLSAELEELLMRYEKIKQNDLAALNSALERAGAMPVSLN